MQSAWSSPKSGLGPNDFRQLQTERWYLRSDESDSFDFHIGELIQKDQPAASPALGEVSPNAHDQVEHEGDDRNAIGIDYGVFSSGFWAPIQPQDGFNDLTYDACNAFFFCSPDGLFGGLVNISYVRRLVSLNRNSLDLDVAAGVGWQSPVVKTSISQGFDYVESYRGGENQFFGLFTVMPTYRLRVFEWLSVGVGGGISYAVGGVPTDTQGGSLNAASKVEIGLRPFENKTIEATFAFNHRCAFFGLLNETGELTGSNWYSLGFRKWF